MSIECTSTVRIISKDGKDFGIGEKEYIKVKSAWNWTRERVVIEFEGMSITVLASDIHKAINNATNCA